MAVVGVAKRGGETKEAEYRRAARPTGYSSRDLYGCVMRDTGSFRRDRWKAERGGSILQDLRDVRTNIPRLGSRRAQFPLMFFFSWLLQKCVVSARRGVRHPQQGGSQE